MINMNDTQLNSLARAFDETRAHTLRLFDLVRDEADLHRSPGFGFRPLLWHLAHIGVFEAYWILQQAGAQASPDERYQRIFDPIATPREESKQLPARAEMEDYLARVRERVSDFMEAARGDSGDDASSLLRDAYVFRLVLEHERQHQETLAYLLQLLDPESKTPPPIDADDEAAAALEVATRDTLPLPSVASLMPQGGMVEVAAGEITLGAAGGAEFVYDNELPAHRVSVPAYKIDRLLTTNQDYAEFVDAGGYARREWWSDEGWTWRERENWMHPLFWSRADGTDVWRSRTMFADGIRQPRHPVVGVSWYEAEAYARFRDKRLPTEAEWVRAASCSGDATANERPRVYPWGDDADDAAAATHGNFDFRRWGTSPVGSFPAGVSNAGCLDMAGNVWEWTSDPFAPFPGFAAYPYPEYSAEWFDGDHRVLKGGSWATRPALLRVSFRNFFRRHFRIAFAGIRCAADT